MRVAVVHDWLYVLGGAEKVLAGILQCFPDATLHCLFDFLTDEERAQIGYRESRTSFLAGMPGIRNRHRLYLPLMPLAVEQFDLSDFDLVISSSYAVAKGVLTGPDQLHISYVHSPMRYAWDLQHQYLRESGMARGIKSWIARALLYRMRLWDMRTANCVDEYIANSHFIARRISKLYGRSARVLYPPVDVPKKPPTPAKGDFFMTASRLVPYKNVHAIVAAFSSELPRERLIVVGDGPDLARLRSRAGANVTFTGFLCDNELHAMLARARAFVFAAEEDFGIAPVEAQAHGTPVIALKRGGVRESLVVTPERRTGLFFDEPSAEAIAAAVRQFTRIEHGIAPEHCHANALRFSSERFVAEFGQFAERRYAEFSQDLERPEAGALGEPARIRASEARARGRFDRLPIQDLSSIPAN